MHREIPSMQMRRPQRNAWAHKAGRGDGDGNGNGGCTAAGNHLTSARGLLLTDIT